MPTQETRKWESRVHDCAYWGVRIESHRGRDVWLCLWCKGRRNGRPTWTPVAW